MVSESMPAWFVVKGYFLFLQRNNWLAPNQSPNPFGFTSYFPLPPPDREGRLSFVMLVLNVSYISTLDLFLSEAINKVTPGILVI